MALILSEYLQVTNEGNRHIQCRKCAHNISSVDKNYKLYTVMKEESVQTANPQNVDSRQYVDKDMVFRRFFLPQLRDPIRNGSECEGRTPRLGYPH